MDMQSRRTAASLLLALTASLALPSATHAAELHEQIDAAVVAKAAGKPSAGLADDMEFLRRAYLDLAGTLPTAQQAREFFADQDAQKRVKLIDRLLASEDFGRRMQQAFTAMLLERRADSKVPDAEWEKYLRESFAANKPWDQLVRELLGAELNGDKPEPAAKFFLVAGRNDQHQKTQDVARLLLGRDIMCAQCHDHPNVDDYLQADYFGLFTFLKEKPEEASSEFESVFVPGKHTTGPKLPGGQEVSIPKFEKDQQEEAAKHRPRVLLAAALPSAENTYFVRNSVNRFWFLMMGRGLVHPLDLDHEANPPSHPEVLDALAADFVAHKFDVKHLLRQIALSQTYQRSSLLPEGLAETDALPELYLVANPKALSPEQMAWALMQATGNLESMLKAPSGEPSKFTYNDYVNGRIDQPPSNLQDALALFIGVFGNPPGEAEVEFNPAMGHALFLLNERLVLNWLEPRDGNLVARLAALSDLAAIVEELYLTVLTRYPTEEEKAELAEFLNKYNDRRDAALGELAWALISSAEFRVSH